MGILSVLLFPHLCHPTWWSFTIALHLSCSLLPMPSSTSGAPSIRTLLIKVKERRVCTHPHSLLWSQHFLFLSNKAPARKNCVYRTPEKVNIGNGILRARRTFPGKQPPDHILIRLQRVSALTLILHSRSNNILTSGCFSLECVSQMLLTGLLIMIMQCVIPIWDTTGNAWNLRSLLWISLPSNHTWENEQQCSNYVFDWLAQLSLSGQWSRAIG